VRGDVMGGADRRGRGLKAKIQAALLALQYINNQHIILSTKGRYPQAFSDCDRCRCGGYGGTDSAKRLPRSCGETSTERERAGYRRFFSKIAVEDCFPTRPLRLTCSSSSLPLSCRVKNAWAVFGVPGLVGGRARGAELTECAVRL
jgi:hypothetical protein